MTQAAPNRAHTVAIIFLAFGAALLPASTAVASTLIGGSGNEGAVLAVHDVSGNIYVAGTTTSTDFPTTPGVAGPSYHGGSHDLYVAKFDPGLTTLLAATYVGGNNVDRYPTLAIDPDGNVLVGGSTLSTDIPVTAGAYQASKSADYDLFVVKLDGDLTSVLAATYLGGSKIDSWGILAMGIDSAGNPVLGCRTTSSNFPTTVGAYDQTYNDYAPDHGDVVVAKLDGTLSTLMASTFIGGALWDEARVLHVDADDTVLVGGDTNNSSSFGAFFPTTAGAYSSCSNHALSRDVFVSRLSADLSTLMASTCLGQSGVNEQLWGITTAPDTSVLLTGRAFASGFPVTGGAYDTSYNGGEDAFVARFDSGLTTLEASTFLGGSGQERPWGIFADSTGKIHATGYTYSSDFPTTIDGFDTSLGGTHDGYHVRFDSTLENLEYGTFVGGSDGDVVYSCFQLGSQLVVHGSTASSDFPTTPGAYDETLNGGSDSFVTRLITVPLQIPVDSQRTRWITGTLLLVLVGFAAWRSFLRVA